MQVNSKGRARCDAAIAAIDHALAAAEYGSLAAQHLERARGHVNEAWIDCDGQNARSVERFLADFAEADKLRVFALSAKKGDTVVAFGKRWRVNNDPEQRGPVAVVKEGEQ
jgi:hypothetical protein